MPTAMRWVGAAAAALVLTTGVSSHAADVPAPIPVPIPAPIPVPIPVPTSSPAPGYSAVGTWQLLALVNKHRRALGLRPLTVDSRLASIARIWTEAMAASGSLQHNNGLFTTASHRALRLKALGENVGWNYSVSAQDTAFMKSSGHRANIVAPGFRVAGFAVVRGADGRIWSTEDFGTPTA